MIRSVAVEIEEIVIAKLVKLIENDYLWWNDKVIEFITIIVNSINLVTSIPCYNVEEKVRKQTIAKLPKHCLFNITLLTYNFARNSRVKIQITEKQGRIELIKSLLRLLPSI